MVWSTPAAKRRLFVPRVAYLKAYVFGKNKEDRKDRQNKRMKDRETCQEETER